MNELPTSNFWFERIPSALSEWGGFFSAIRHELETLVRDGHVGEVTVLIPEEEQDEDEYRPGIDEPFKLTFYLSDHFISVYFSNNRISGDEFTINQDLTWSYDPEDCGKTGELTPGFLFWLHEQVSLAGTAAVLAVALAKAWIITPPSFDAGLSYEARKPWAH